MSKLVQKLRNLFISSQSSEEEKIDNRNDEKKDKGNSYHTSYISSTQANSDRYDNLIQDEKADYPPHSILSLNAKGRPSNRAGSGPYLGGYPVNLHIYLNKI